MSDNYTKVYEMKFIDKKELSSRKLLLYVLKSFKEKKAIATDSGTFYIKDFEKKNNGLIFLFGKDNDDASNYKRKRKNIDVEKIAINEKTEILTDFVHIGISKSERLGTYILLLERNKLITHFNIMEFIDSFLLDRLQYSLSRRVTIDFFQEVQEASRIIKIKQITKASKLPLPSNNSSNDLKDIEIEENIEIKAKRSKKIPFSIFKIFFDKFGNDPKSKIIVDIINKSGNSLSLDFDIGESPYTVRLPISMNNRTDIIQINIAYEINDWIKKDNEGALN